MGGAEWDNIINTLEQIFNCRLNNSSCISPCFFRTFIYEARELQQKWLLFIFHCQRFSCRETSFLPSINWFNCFVARQLKLHHWFCRTEELTGQSICHWQLRAKRKQERHISTELQQKHVSRERIITETLLYKPFWHFTKSLSVMRTDLQFSVKVSTCSCNTQTYTHMHTQCPRAHNSTVCESTQLLIFQ